jgi:hypothetical protein
MREVVNSFVRLSTTLTVFGIQQVQTVIDAMDTETAMDRARNVLDGMTDSLASQMDENKRTTAETMARAGEEMVDRTWKAPADVVGTTTEFVRRTSDAVSKAVANFGSGSSTSEPVTAEEAFATSRATS